jgi:hypothetical protein
MHYVFYLEFYLYKPPSYASLLLLTHCHRVSGSLKT